MAAPGCSPLPVVFCFLLGEKKVLLYRRMTDPWNGTITVPGGKKERGETAREACIREIEEETGYRLGSIRLRGIAHILSGEAEATGYYFSSRDFEGELRKSDEGVPFWYSAEESLSLEGVNPFYKLLAPRILDETAPFFEAKIFSDEQGIRSFSFENV
ncbi:NUDIX domain-containing protein [Aminivibrio sp.]|jgi:ADP-ribose pyrophosphatase YjhB (NUDIX family)|uniref:NUDIX domain-containing protein n=1 Tax=Aminivibrio sp. TaxID=1872489 RepID=UPI001A5E58E2|nr:NUDIX domain-containing protein [Aminivibrio sp.]MBL3539289.1 NUDIX domain-containing protein [Aminivibrio sp.]MDK2959039.1 8-oxo-dGTP diphosphatase [Synergistaceae bacterium]